MTLLLVVAVSFLAGALTLCWVLAWAEDDRGGYTRERATDAPPEPPATPGVGLPETRGRRR